MHGVAAAAAVVTAVRRSAQNLISRAQTAPVAGWRRDCAHLFTSRARRTDVPRRGYVHRLRAREEARRMAMDFQSAMETFAEAWVAANTKTDPDNPPQVHNTFSHFFMLYLQPHLPLSSYKNCKYHLSRQNFKILET